MLCRFRPAPVAVQGCAWNGREASACNEGGVVGMFKRIWGGRERCFTWNKDRKQKTEEIMLVVNIPNKILGVRCLMLDTRGW